jgi:hypothetical protein
MRLPTASEILQTEALIRSQTENIAAVDAEYKAMKRKLDLVGAKRNAMMQELLKNKAYLARVRALPQEVLGLVFIFYADDTSHSPWTLMQVNRAWRATALSTRSIWGKIMLTSPAWQKYGAPRTKDGREICGTKEQLDRALRRAGNAALDILFSLANPHGRRTYRKYDRMALCQMVTLLASSRKCLQVRHLEIDGSCGHNLTWQEEYDGLQFPQLKTLRVKSCYTSEFVAKISATTKQVTEVELSVPSFYRINSSFGLEDFVKYSSLTSLTLDGRQAHGIEGDGFVRLKRALDNAPFITTLELTRMNLYMRNPPAPIFRFPNVRTLILSKGSMPWAFDIPGLTNLTLTEGSCIPPGPPESNRFPNLTSLTIDAPLSWGRIDYLKAIVISPIHTLDLCFGKRKDALLELMDHQVDLNPVVFRLRKTAVPAAALTDIIDNMNRLEELELDEIALKKEFFDFLASPKTYSDNSLPLPSGGTEMHCPLLVRLRVHAKGGTQAQNKNIKTAARKAVKARVSAGIAVESWLIRCSEDKKWTDLA